MVVAGWSGLISDMISSRALTQRHLDLDYEPTIKNHDKVFKK